MMTNHIFEHLELHFDVMFIYEGNTLLLPIMHIFQITVYIGYSDNSGRLEMSPLNSHTNFIGYSDTVETGLF